MAQRRKTSVSSCLPVTPHGHNPDRLSAFTTFPNILDGTYSADAATADDIVLCCAKWLSIDDEREGLTLEWASLEHQLITLQHTSGTGESRYPKFRGPDRLELLVQANKALRAAQDAEIDSISKRPAASIQALAYKLAVAARLLVGEGGPAYAIVADAAAALCTVPDQTSVPPARSHTRRYRP